MKEPLTIDEILKLMEDLEARSSGPIADRIKMCREDLNRLAKTETSYPSTLGIRIEVDPFMPRNRCAAFDGRGKLIGIYKVFAGEP